MKERESQLDSWGRTYPQAQVIWDERLTLGKFIAIFNWYTSMILFVIESKFMLKEVAL